MQRRIPRGLGALALTGLFLLGLTALPTADDPPKFSGWSAPVNLGPVVNSAAYDACPTISKDGLSLYFRSNRPGSQLLPNSATPSLDIWVTQRDSVDDPWGVPVNLGPTVNSPYHEYCTTFSPDGHWMVFVSQRPGCGNQDLWISHRKNKRDDLGWETPEMLNCGATEVNSTAAENGPAWFEEEATGRTLLYFSSGRPGGLGGLDIYVSEALGQAKDEFGSPVPVVELNTTALDYQPVLRKDGLEIFFASNRPGSQQADPVYGLPPGAPSVDIWFAVRDSLEDPWSPPENVGPLVNSPFWDFHPTLSRDGTALIFASERGGSSTGWSDLWMATREKLRGPRP